jgi:hypothetical protein
MTDNIAAAVKLIPCKVCGKMPEANSMYGVHWVGHICMGVKKRTENEAIAAWNTANEKEQI